MMKKNKFIIQFLVILFIEIIAILSITNMSVKATTINAIDDGIENWVPGKGTGSIKLGNNMTLNYTFGGPYTGDPFPKYQSPYKMIVSLNDNGKIVNTVSFNQLGATTSDNYMIAPDENVSHIDVVNNLRVFSSAMDSPSFYIGHDKDNNTVLKVVGTYSNSAVGNLNFEVLLRPAVTGAPVIQRELFLQNKDATSHSFRVLYGEDDSLNGKDYVPMLSLGNKEGLYMRDGNTDVDSKYRFSISNQTQDGFNQYAGVFYWTNNWLTGFNPQNLTGSGVEADPTSTYGSTIVSGNDTMYTLKWNRTTIAPGQTTHYASLMGVVAKGYSLPHPSKSYVNKTNSTGLNNIGDKLGFTLKMINNGYDAVWNYQKLVDKLPEGLQIDPDSIKLHTTINGINTETAVDKSDYDSATRTLTVNPNCALTNSNVDSANARKDSATVTFDANVTNDAFNQTDSDKNLTNTAEFTGVDNLTSSSVKTYDASVKIPIQEPNFDFSFTKLVRNETNGENNYATSTVAKNDNIIDYLITYKLASTSKETLTAGAVLDDKLPTGLNLIPDSIVVTAPDGTTTKPSSLNTILPAVDKGQMITVGFKAKVAATADGLITNNATLNKVKTSTGNSFDSITSSGADVNVEDVDSIAEVPSLIDFGTVNSIGMPQTITNTLTRGELLINHPTTKSYKVSVSYQTPMNDGKGNSLPSYDNNLLYIRQRNNKYTDVGTWTPVMPYGTDLQKSDFTDYGNNLHLTDYVGVDDWQMHMGSNAKAGKYNGTLT